MSQTHEKHYTASQLLKMS